MKKIIAGAVSLTLALGCLALPAEVGNVFRSGTVIEASADTYGDFTYKSLADGTYTISGYSGSGGFVTIPSSINGINVTAIANYAFKGNTAITGVSIPNTVTIIGDDAFCGCSNITSVSLGSNVTTISGYAFAGCLALDSITFPSSLTTIKASAFFNCGSLSSISFPSSVTTIGNSAFENCSGLRTVTIPSTVTSLGSLVFYTCTSLESINVDTENQFYASVNGVLFNKAKTKLLQYPIGNTKTSYTVPSGVTMIGDSAFESCPNLTDLYFDSELTTIGEYAFYNNSALKNVTIEAKVKTIGYSAFNECLNLSNVYYAGDQTQWKAINIDDDNSNLTRASIKYNYNEEHVHSYTSKVTVPATCTDEGLRTYTCACGDSYTEVIKAIGHNFVASVVAPTYEEQGYTQHKCSHCGYTYKDSYTDKLTVPAAAISQTYTSTGTGFTLNWAKASGVTGYKIYKYNGSSGKWELIKTVSGENTLSTTVTGYKPGSVIKFRVNAYVVNNGKTYIGESDTYLYAAALANAKISSSYTSTGTSYTLNWGKVQGASGYKIYKYSGTAGKWVLVKTVSGGSTTSTTVTGITPGSVIKFKVNAYLTKGTKTYYGKTDTSIYATALAPAKISSSYTSTGTSYTLNWGKIQGATGYKVYRYNGSTGKWVLVKTVNGGSTTSTTVTGFTPGSVIKFKVNACVTKGTKTYVGKTDTFLYAAALAKASLNSSYTSTATTAAVSWKKVAGATGYKIYKYNEGSNTWTAIKTVTGADTLSTTITGLTSGTNTKIKVNAYLTKGDKTYVGKTGTMLTVKTK